MGINVKSKNPGCIDLMNDKEWFESYKEAYENSDDEKFAEAFMAVSAEADRILMNEM